jgi:hypothetical protein
MTDRWRFTTAQKCRNPGNKLAILIVRSDYLHDGYLRHTLWAGKEIVMDTTTYASVAMLPRSVAEDHMRFVRQDQELLPLDLSMIKR